VAMTPFDWHNGGTLKTAVPLDAPSCSEARAYFAERLEAEDGIGRAALLTHAEDPTIAEGEGVILVVPSAGGGHVVSPLVKMRALEVARAIPCSHKLALRVEDPFYRPFIVDVELALYPGADRASALQDAQEELRDLFAPNGRALESNHVAFGADEKTFGYHRVRGALRYVMGVKGIHLKVNGSDADVALDPRDFPALESLAIHQVDVASP
jgi:hypothetical protein